MIISKPTVTQTSSKFDATGNTSPNATQPPPSYARSKPAVDAASVSRIYDLKNPTHEVLKKLNEHLAASTGPLLRKLKDDTGIKGNTIFNFPVPGGKRAIMNGTATSHTVRFEGPPSSSISIKNGEITGYSGNLTPITLNRNLSVLAAALQAPNAAQILRKNG